jgi:hypothetical protein
VPTLMVENHTDPGRVCGSKKVGIGDDSDGVLLLLLLLSILPVGLRKRVRPPSYPSLMLRNVVDAVVAPCN